MPPTKRGYTPNALKQLSADITRSMTRGADSTSLPDVVDSALERYAERILELQQAVARGNETQWSAQRMADILKRELREAILNAAKRRT